MSGIPGIFVSLLVMVSLTTWTSCTKAVSDFFCFSNYAISYPLLLQTGDGEFIGSASTTSSPVSSSDPAFPRARAALFSTPADSLIADDGRQGRSLPSLISILSSILQPIILALLFQQLQPQQQQQPPLAQLLQQQLIQQQLVQQQLLRQQLLRQQFGVSPHSRATATTQNARRPSIAGGLTSLGSGQGFGLGLPFGFGSSSLPMSFGNDQDIFSSLDLNSLLQVPSDPRSPLTRFKKSSTNDAGLKRTERGPSSRSGINEEVKSFSQSSDGVLRLQPNLPSLPLGSATTLDGVRDSNSQSSSTDNQIRFPLFRALLEPATTFSQTPLFRNEAPSIDRRPVQQSPNTLPKEDPTSNANSDFSQITSYPRTLDHSLTTFYRNLPLTKDVQKSIQLFLEPQTRMEIEFVESGGQESDSVSAVETAAVDGTAHLIAALLFANDEDLAKETTVASRGKEKATKRLRFPDV